ncbi:16S rRNA (guanine(966)-N(2))-methyltransferase RsmD [uncultured Bifidobacterium sp.]|uniref:16S rRNA (guanine(966)-N(2))-methyltransferase RsmD n=1 Tax=uncultured Bifidobacterium sp. TaxID=165187 RepID=UPI00260D19E4|nr:16S rRNA (guanine(966)-N(2))-methyltransferase RsmD [uncultured Bifidobacterium sp.]
MATVVAMHVIAGRFKGTPLASAPSGTRPTTDRTKEAVFSRLEAWNMLEGSRVLDLFAGTGALGFEALSRGAASLVAVDSSSAATTAIQRVADRMRIRGDGSAHVDVRTVKMSVYRYLRSAASECFDVVFADPPYDHPTEGCEEILGVLSDQRMLPPEGIVVMERSARSRDPREDPRWSLVDRRTYGETEVLYYEITSSLER